MDLCIFSTSLSFSWSLCFLLSMMSNQGCHWRLPRSSLKPLTPFIQKITQILTTSTLNARRKLEEEGGSSLRTWSCSSWITHKARGRFRRAFKSFLWKEIGGEEGLKGRSQIELKLCFWNLDVENSTWRLVTGIGACLRGNKVGRICVNAFRT